MSKNRNKAGRGKKIKMDQAPKNPPEEIITQNPWDGLDESEWKKTVLDGVEADFADSTFATLRSGQVWVNLGRYHVRLRKTERGIVVSEMSQWGQVCDIHDIRDANERRARVAKAAKKLKIKV